MNREILMLQEQIREAWEGEPWYGRNIGELILEVNEKTAFQKPSGQHSIMELVWHMINWKAFVINRLKKESTISLSVFETNDWRDLDHTDNSLWSKGLSELERVHKELVDLISQQNDGLLAQKVEGKSYNYRKMLHGVHEHDIYHAGQIAYLKKLLQP